MKEISPILILFCTFIDTIIGYIAFLAAYLIIPLFPQREKKIGVNTSEANKKRINLVEQAAHLRSEDGPLDLYST